MSALARLEHLPDWPVRMTAPVAAAYMCVSVTTFLTRYGSRGVKEGSNTFWARAQLDRYVADQFGLAGTIATDSVEDEIAAWEARCGRK